MPKNSYYKLNFIFHVVLSVSSIKLYLNVDYALSLCTLQQLVHLCPVVEAGEVLVKEVCLCSAHGIGWSTPISGYCPLCGLVYCSSSTSLAAGILFLSWHSSVSLLMRAYGSYSTLWPRSEEPHLPW